MKEQVCNTIGEVLLSYEDFLIGEEDMDLYREKLDDCRNEFKMANDSSRMINYTDFCVYGFMFSEISNFYNNDICIDVAKILTMLEGKETYKFRVVRNFVDTVTVKICSCWEYLFQILNQYFMLELNSLNQNKEIIEKMYSKKMVFIKCENGYRIDYIEWSDEEREDVRKEIKKREKVLHIGKGAKDFKKAIKKQGYVVSERVQQISALYSEKSVRMLKDKIRNTITHKKSATFAYTIGDLDDVLPIEGITCDKSGWIKEEIDVLLQENIEILKSAVQIAYDIVCLGDRLIRCGNEDKKYMIVGLECPKCKYHMNLIRETYEIDLKYDVPVVCSDCGENMILTGEGEVSEFDFNRVLLKDIEYHTNLLEGDSKK